MNTQLLQKHDLQFAIIRLPRLLAKLMQSKEYAGKVFVGGGYLRAIVSGEKVSDVDVFVTDKVAAERLARALLVMRWPDKFPAGEKGDVFYNKHAYTTDNAITLTDFSPTIQIIHRWVFERPEDIIASFDFTICCAAIWHDGVQWNGICDPNFYPDLAAHRLVYRSPVRIEEAGGSLLRVLKYYQRGYRIPLDSLGAVLARIFSDVSFAPGKIEKVMAVHAFSYEAALAHVLTSLLRVVDPMVDPLHEAHLPADNQPLPEEVEEVLK